eukprot:3802362-Rhodomonas_salina.1
MQLRAALAPHFNLNVTWPGSLRLAPAPGLRALRVRLIFSSPQIKISGSTPRLRLRLWPA